MAEKLSDKLKGLFKRADTYLGKAIERKPKITKAMGPSQTQYKMFKAGQKTKNLMKGLSLTKKFDQPASASKALITASAAKKARNIGKLKTIGRIASRAALPVAAGFEAANLAYKVATLSPEKKAKIKKLKTELSKKSTKQSHADLLKMSTGGDTMLTGGQKKLDKNKDGKISGEDFKMMKARVGRSVETAGSKKIKNEDSRRNLIKRLREEKLGPVMETRSNQEIRDALREKKMMKANMGMEAKSSKGYGAARTSGMGLQDEELIPGKSLDYYKDVM
jgi:hypothetical protein